MARRGSGELWGRKGGVRAGARGRGNTGRVLVVSKWHRTCSAREQCPPRGHAAEPGDMGSVTAGGVGGDVDAP